MRNFYAETQNAVDHRFVRRDYRGIGKKFGDALKRGRFLSFFLMFLMLVMLIFPSATPLIFLIGLVSYLNSIRGLRRGVAPMRLPAEANTVDYGDPIPGTSRNQFFKAQGRFYAGVEDGTLRQLWAKAGDMLTHILIFGSTGSGKTEAMLSLVQNAVLNSSGYAYVDPKAAIKLHFQMFTAARLFWREPDYRLLNYITGNKAPTRAKSPYRTSNTVNPFNKGNAESASSILTSLITVPKDGNAVFGTNAQNMMMSAMRGLVDRREMLRVALNIQIIRDSVSPSAMIKLSEDPMVSPTTKTSILAFLNSLGYVPGAPLEKQQQFTAQYGYALAYFSQALNSLTDSYGHIYVTPFGEVDYADVIKQRRLLLVMLPSLEKSPAELSNMGKVILGGMRNAVSTGLVAKSEGTRYDVLDNLPMSAPYPFMMGVDEYAAIATEGFVQVLTQGRGIGISAMIGSQDFSGLKGASEVEAQQCVENTKIKAFGTMDVGEDTWELLKKTADEHYVASTQGGNTKGDMGSYADNQEVHIDRTSRVELRDLQEQVEGEFHFIFRGRVIRGEAFYANPPLEKHTQVRVNQMLSIEWPREADVVRITGALNESVNLMSEWIENNEALQAPPDAGISMVSDLLQDTRDRGVRESAAIAILLFDRMRHAAPPRRADAPVNAGHALDAAEPVFDYEEVDEDVLDGALAEDVALSADMVARQMDQEIARNYPPAPPPKEIDAKDYMTIVRDAVRRINTEKN